MRLKLLSVFLLSSCWLAYAQTPSDLFVKVQLNDTIKTSKLQPGDVVAGTVLRDVYSADRKVISAGSPIRLTVDRLEKRRRAPNDYWPWVIQAFTPRHESFPIFRQATVTPSDGPEVPLQVSWFAMRRERQIDAPPAQSPSQTKTKASKTKQSAPPQIITLEASRANEMSSVPTQTASTLTHGPISLPPGTEGKIILLDDLSAGKNLPGDAFHARLIEPIHLDSGVTLPEGTLLQGTVTRRTPPRMLSRAGSIFLTFTRLQLPGGAPSPVSASITAAQLDQRSHTRIDREGQLRGDRPGKAWMLINVGVTAGIAKEVDDGTQLVIEALVSTATDASTAGTARIAATCASGLFMLTRHGRDVVLPKFTEMSVMFDRPAPNPPASQAAPEARPNPQHD